MNTNLIKYDAAWLSPEGIFYGSNGNEQDFLHIKLADELFSNHTVDYTSSNPNYMHDTLLELNGWARIHYDEVLFLPYASLECSSIVTFMTLEQKMAIYEYAKLFYKNVMKFGYKKEPIHVYKFIQMDDYNIANIFK